MAVAFNADEVLAMAQAIEVNGARFYDAAAAKAPQGRSRDLLAELAKWERTHEKTFAQMRRELPAAARETSTYDPDDEAQQYLRALADSRVFDPGADPMALLGPKPSQRDVLLKALELEKESIAFYVGLRAMVKLATGQDRVDEVIREEMRHVALLHDELAQGA
jgi:rubrerythrin